MVRVKLEPGTFSTAQTRCRRSNRLSHEYWHESVSIHVSQPLSCYRHTYSTRVYSSQTTRDNTWDKWLSKTKTIVSSQTKLEISYQYFSFSQNSFIVERSLISSNDLSTETIPFSDFSSMNDTLSNPFKVI